MKKLNNKHQEWLWGYIFVLPALLGFICFMAYPTVYGLYLSFFDVKLFDKEFIGLANYMTLFTDINFILSIGRTAYYTIGVLVIGIPLALFLAILVNQKIKGISFFRTIYYMPVITMMIAASMIWKGLLGTNYGLINYILDFIGIENIPWLTDPKWSMPAIILMSIWKGTGFNMIVFLGGLQTISGSLYEAAKIDGANKMQTFFKITLPMLSPTIFFVIITTMINSFQVFEQAMVLTKGGPQNSTTTIVYYIYNNAFAWFKPGYASAQAVVLFLILLTITGIQFKMQKRWVHYD
jgi:multiple sugar transport system permease protein